MPNERMLFPRHRSSARPVGKRHATRRRFINGRKWRLATDEALFPVEPECLRPLLPDVCASVHRPAGRGFRGEFARTSLRSLQQAELLTQCGTPPVASAASDRVLERTALVPAPDPANRADEGRRTRYPARPSSCASVRYAVVTGQTEFFRQTSQKRGNGLPTEALSLAEQPDSSVIDVHHTRIIGSIGSSSVADRFDVDPFLIDASCKS